MIKIENTDVYGFEAAIRGMRNPMNSWDKSDSHWGCDDIWCVECDKLNDCNHSYFVKAYSVGENDLKLMKNLSKAGTDHSKYLRMITVTCDITAPLYWYKEFDTYKVGTVANSCSTMHKIHDRPFTVHDFSYDHLMIDAKHNLNFCQVLEDLVDILNSARNGYLDTGDKQYWWQMIQLLPSSYNQRRTVQLNYQVLKNMYHARKTHKLDEWREFCNWCETLPYFKEICIDI